MPGPNSRSWKKRAREQLTGKVVAITGGAGGIGQAFAQIFTELGASVALLDLNLAGLQELSAEVPGALVQALDITDLEACDRAFSAICEEMGGIDVLINNAGITNVGRFADTDVDTVRRIMEVNFFGAVNCTKAALPSLRQRGGHIVAISSVAGFAPLLGRTAYAASKHALHGFFDSLRVELQPDGVGVHLICPSYVATPIRDHATGSQPGSRPGSGRLLTPADVAAATVRAIIDGRRQTLVSPTAKAAFALHHVAPGLYERLMKRNTHDVD